MKKAINERYKRVVVDFNLTSKAHMDIFEELDQAAEALGLKRSILLRQLIKDGLKQLKNQETK